MSKILHLDEQPALTPSAKLKIAGFENLILPDNAPDDVVLSEIQDAKYVISGSKQVGEEHFKEASKLHAVVLPSAGYDYIDTDAATRHGVYVVNSPGANSNAVAEMTIGLLLAVARNIPQSYTRVRAGDWIDEAVRNQGLGYELTGKTMGLVGLGHIGSRVAKIASGFSMKVLCFTKRPSPEREQECGVKFVSLNELMQQADFVAICAALNSDTLGLVGAEQIKQMKKNAFLVNTARGKIVDYDALYEALAEHRIAGAGIDVLYAEPPGPTHPFFELENVIVTPHLGSRTRDANERVTNLVADEILRMEAGEKPLNPVNEVTG
jgi:phosphoglycerate dehydrogenase-like enzyme